MKIIDTHIHIWNFTKARYTWLDNDTSILNRHYEIAELEPERTAAGITGGILVQAANNTEDTDWMLATAAATPWLQGVVGWLPLTDPAVTEKLLTEKYLHNQYFKGVRHLVHNEADTRWLLQPEVVESLQLLAAYDIPYDVVGIVPEHIETALELAEKLPQLRMIFDHLNQPPIAAGEKYGRWGSLMKAASEHPNFYAKISGLGTVTQKGANWQEADIEPYIAFVLEHFGLDRCCCGGDWPVSLLADTYTRTWSIYKNVLKKLLDQAAQQKVFYESAALFYNLPGDE